VPHNDEPPPLGGGGGGGLDWRGGLPGGGQKVNARAVFALDALGLEPLPPAQGADESTDAVALPTVGLYRFLDGSAALAPDHLEDQGGFGFARRLGRLRGLRFLGSLGFGDRVLDRRLDRLGLGGLGRNGHNGLLLGGGFPAGGFLRGFLAALRHRLLLPLASRGWHRIRPTDVCRRADASTSTERGAAVVQSIHSVGP